MVQNDNGGNNNFFDKKIIVLLGDPKKNDVIKKGGKFNPEDLQVVNSLKAALKTLPFEFIFLNSHDSMVADLVELSKQGKCLVLNLCDEGFNNNPLMDLHITALLEILGWPYTGANPHAMALSYDKAAVHLIAQQIGIAVPYTFLAEEGDNFTWSYDWPVIVKPNFTHGSFGLTADNVVSDQKALNEAMKRTRQILKAAGFQPSLKIEEFLPGNELTIGFIGNPPEPSSLLLPMIMEDYSQIPADLPKICGHEAKWDPESPYWQLKSKKAELPAATQALIEKWTMKLFSRLGCRDYARFDWRLDAQGYPKLLDANPNCGWTDDSHLAKMCNLAGITYSEMLLKIIKAAESRLRQ